MCHPALPGPVEHGQQRVAEFEVLASAELREWLVGNGLSVTRLSQMIPVNASQRSARRLAWDEADRPVISR
ncbi:putative exported domain protein [Bordetella holmesii 44057]|nr:hypothetical protein [Bordetella holmesii]AIT26751.1 putative exported domain protein [Bordetella holmesii 44057]